MATLVWSAAVEEEYRSMLDGAMGAAFGGLVVGPFSVGELLINKLRAIEDGESGHADPAQTNSDHLTTSQVVDLWIARVAWNFFMERLQFFPWRLRDKTADELKPLLGFAHQGIVRYQVGKNQHRWQMHSVWDVDPAMRATEGILSAVFSALTGNPLQDEQGAIEAVIEGMRNAG